MTAAKPNMGQAISPGTHNNSMQRAALRGPPLNRSVTLSDLREVPSGTGTALIP